MSPMHKLSLTNLQNLFFFFFPYVRFTELTMISFWKKTKRMISSSEREIGRLRDKRREKHFHLLLHYLHDYKDHSWVRWGQNGPGWAHKPGASSSSSTWTQIIGLCFVVSSRPLTLRCIGSQAAGFELVSICDGGIAGGSFLWIGHIPIPTINF